MPLGTEANLGPGDVVLDGNPAPPVKGAEPPICRPMSVVAKRLMDKDATCTEVEFGPGHIVLDRDPAFLVKGAHQPHSFWPMSIVATKLSSC